MFARTFSHVRRMVALPGALTAAACSLQSLDTLGGGTAGAGGSGIASPGVGGTMSAASSGGSGGGISEEPDAALPEAWVSLSVEDAGAGLLIPDHSFEAGVDGWVTLGTARVSQSADRPRSGGYCMSVTGRNEAWAGATYDMASVVVQGERYNVSVWLRSREATVRQNITLRHACVGEAVRYTQVYASLVNPSWTRLASAFTVPRCASAESESDGGAPSESPLAEFVLILESDETSNVYDFDVDDLVLVPATN